MLLWSQLTFGVAAVMAQLDVPVDCRSMMLSWLYPNGGAPPPYTREQVAAIHPDLV